MIIIAICGINSDAYMKNYMIVLLGKRNPFGYYDNCCYLWNKFGRVHEELYDCFTQKTESFRILVIIVLVCGINLGAYIKNYMIVLLSIHRSMIYVNNY